MRRVGVRVRLATVAALTFGSTAALLAVVLLGVVEQDLLDDTADDAEATLVAHLETLSAGDATSSDNSSKSRFGAPTGATVFYDAADGSSLSAGEFSTLTTSPGSSTLSTGSIALSMDPTTIRAVDRGDDLAAVATTLTIGADDYTVGAAASTQPVTDSIAAVRTGLWIALPTLTALVGVFAFYLTGRALRPVRQMTDRVGRIDPEVTLRVPVPPGDDEIHDLATTMNHMLDRLHNSRCRQRELAADASHELRSPVAASRAQLEVALGRPAEADWEETARTVLAEQERLGAVVEDLLTLSRLEEIGTDLGPDVDLDDVVRDEAGRPQPRSVSVQHCDPVRIRGSREQVARALRNVIDNAAEAATSKVGISLTEADGTAVVTVDDDGPGIDEEAREHVFERFTRLDEARDRARGGTGLGLAITREIVRAHGGDVVIGQSPAGGARVVIELPTRQSHDHPPGSG